MLFCKFILFCIGDTIQTFLLLRDQIHESISVLPELFLVHKRGYAITFLSRVDLYARLFEMIIY